MRLPIRVISWDLTLRRSSAPEGGVLHFSRCLRGYRCTRDLPPGLESVRHLLTVLGGGEAVPPRPELLGNGAIGGEKALRVPWGFKAPQAPLALGPRLMRVFCAVVQIPVLAVFHARQELALGGAVALALIRDDHSWEVPTPLEQLAEERLRSGLIAMALDQDIQHVPVLINGPPEVVPFAVDGEEDFLQMPLIARSRTPASQLIGIGPPKLPAPMAYGFIGQHDPVCGHQFFNIPIAQAEAKVEPDTVIDNLRRKPMALIWTGD